MKHGLKTISCLTLVLVLLMSLTIPAFAVSSITFQGFSDGFVFEPGSEYTRTDLFGNFKDVMPGDVLTEEITFTNAAKDCDFVQLYIRAVPHEDAADSSGDSSSADSKNPLSDSVAATENFASMTEFLSQLSMKVYHGSELIYDATADELDGLKDNKFLGVYRSGETTTLTVELTVPVTLDNRFANRVGEVDWVFHVEAYNESQLSVRKVWSDGNANHAEDSITVNLLKDGEVETTAVLNAENGWAYTFDRLVEGYNWSVQEAEVPAGYTVSYQTEGNTTVITNTKDTPPTPSTPNTPVTITAEKVWSNDKGKSRPTSVTVTLYNGSTAYQTVQLNASNHWRYTWNNLDASGNWQVTEINIPNGYTPSYHVSGNVVTITNTATLIQTGQLTTPIFVCAGIGFVLLLAGCYLIARKKRKQNG